MNLPLISIIVPIYNLELYLDICLSSIIKQIYPNLEIILVNDGSTDSSLSICEKYCQLDSRIKVISQVNSGVSVARNTGLEYAKGEYICFIDGDDYIIPNYIQLLADAIIEYQTDISVCKIAKLKHTDFNIVKMHSANKKVSVIDSKKALCEMIYQRDLSWEVVAKLYSKKSLQGLLFDKNESIGEDFTFSYHYLHNCNGVAVCDFTGYYYLLRSGSATQSQFSEKHRSILNVANKFERFICDNYPKLSHCSTYFTLHSYVDLVDRLYFSDSPNRDSMRIYKNQIVKRIMAMLPNRNIKLKFKIRVLIMLINPALYRFIKRKIN